MAVEDGDSPDGAEAPRLNASPRRRALSPQEKKALSYSRDRRNSYGESPHGSRKNIPRAKARSHREARRKDKAALHDVGAALETVPLRLRRPAWKKWADRPLGQHVRVLLWRRAAAEARARGKPEPGWKE